MGRPAQREHDHWGAMYDATPEPLDGAPGARQSELPEGWREADAR